MSDTHNGLDYLRERVEEHEQVIEGVFRNSHHMTEQVARLGVQVQELSSDVRKLRDEVPAMLMQSAIDIVGNPKFWEAGRTAMASHARNATGGWVLGWLGSMFTRPMGLVILLLLLYQFGGVTAVMGWIKARLVV
jgi:hypothetical protein